MSGLRWITGWGNNGALCAFWMGFVPVARLALRASRLIDRDRDAFGASRLTTVAVAAPPFGSRPFCCGSNMNVLLTSERTVAFFGERRILSTV